MNRRLIYSVNVGLKDTPIEHYPFIVPDCDYFYFCDMGEVLTKTWIHLFVNNFELNNYNSQTRFSKALKFLPQVRFPYFQNYSIALYIDANIKVTENLEPYFKLFEESGKDFGFVRIRGLSGLYGHILKDLENQKDKPEILHKTIAFYQKEKYPEDYDNLFITGFFFFRISNIFTHFGDKMLGLISDLTHRCQIHLPYLLWKYKFSYMELPINYDWKKNQFDYSSGLKVMPHLKRSIYIPSPDDIKEKGKRIQKTSMIGNKNNVWK